MVCALPSISCCTISSLTIEKRQSLQSSPKSSLGTLETQLLHKFNSVSELKIVHSLLIKSGTPLSELPLSRVASVCALTPSFLYAQRIFQQVGQPEIVTWNCCLRDFAESDTPFNAILLFHQLQRHNVCPDSFTCSFVLKACVKLMDLSHGRIIHALVVKLDLLVNLVLQNVILHLYASCGEMSDAILLFDKMSQRDIVTWNTMITQLVKKGDIDSAYKMFSEMPDRNLRSWTAMIAGFVRCRKPKKAIDIFKEMEQVGLKPNEATVVAVLSACADLGALDLGSRLHDYSNKSGFKANVLICNTLIDMYIKCGCLEAAKDVFEGMKKRTVVSWSAMIQGLALHGNADEAFGLFFRMTQAGVNPNGVTFIGLLNACSHMGLVNKGRAFFARMTNDFAITPGIEHYGCMVDLLSRAGLLHEAHEFIKEMPIKPNAAIWGALLGGCKVHKNVEMAEVATRHLHELDPHNDGYYVVLANTYSEAKKWEDAARVRKLMRERGLKKTYGCSSITVDGLVHEFVAGDESHSQSEEIFEKWKQLLVPLRLKGYVPNTSVVLLDMEEDEKEKYLFRHSEKLAVVFGLINLAPRETVRIFKNLRVCEDCHAAFKLLSEIVKREILVRDRSRFHCFKDGSCSCKDYW
ncbi:pentatricopeptide repeat-containing protein At5g66520-like [Salvia miltiorrhiza]|uniref:pentatricopeptide repeat-containing protein At5g66520-like n=1 Tax=Salvia miltiorrhiza TaxID=226208 RepID=UPI0025ABA3F5|nr:pentatricopeptide repeat-containing protein At5g66520-like [Salvia miltiorrhiza]XP_057807461.1 pentatricopeptide repeat-containing protein At5g66520-like [Salvia miltiorrhiza]